MNTPEYDCVIEDESYETFLLRCNRFVREGWKAQGGLCVSTYRSIPRRGRKPTIETLYAQAFVKGDK